MSTAESPPTPDWRVVNTTIEPTPESGAGSATYHVVVMHDLPAPADLAIGCAPPAGATGMSASHPPRILRGSVVWEFSSIPPGDTVRLQVRFPGASAAPIRFRIATRPAPVPVLAIRLEAPLTVPLDEEFPVTVKLLNSGTPARGVDVSLAIPDTVVYRAATAGGFLAESGRAVEWKIPDLPTGTEWTGTTWLVGFAPGPIQLPVTATCPPARASADLRLVCEIRAGSSALADLLATLGAEAEDLSEASHGEETGVPYLVFRVGGNRFALPIAAISEIIRPSGLTPVPGAPPWLAGVANVRGDIVPVVAIAGLLGLNVSETPRALVVIRPPEDDQGIGLLADDVLGIRPLLEESELSGEMVDEARAQFLSGLALDRGELVQRLDITRVLQAVENGLAQDV